MDRDDIFSELAKNFSPGTPKSNRKRRSSPHIRNRQSPPKLPIKGTEWIQKHAEIGLREKPATFKQLCERHASLTERVKSALVRCLYEPITYFNHIVCKAEAIDEDDEIWLLFRPSENVEQVKNDAVIEVIGAFDARNVLFVHSFDIISESNASKNAKTIPQKIFSSKLYHDNDTIVRVVRSVLLETTNQFLSVVIDYKADKYLLILTFTVLFAKRSYSIEKWNKVRQVETVGPNADIFVVELLENAGLITRIGAKMFIHYCSEIELAD